MFLFRFGDFLLRNVSRGGGKGRRSKNVDDKYHLLDDDELDDKKSFKDAGGNQSSNEGKSIYFDLLIYFPLILALIAIVLALIFEILPLLLSSIVSETFRVYDVLHHWKVQFVYEHPYNTSSYYTSTKSIKTLIETKRLQVDTGGRETSTIQRSLVLDDEDSKFNHQKMKKTTRFAIVRPFCEFDVESASQTFECWECFLPCKAAATNTSIEKEESCKKTLWGDTKQERRTTFNPSQEAMGDTQVDLFLFYSQTFSDNPKAVNAMDTIIDAFNSKKVRWSQCFDNIYAIEGKIPREKDLYLPSAKEVLYNWVNGPNRQHEILFRIIQNGTWGGYDAYYVMEGDSFPIKSYWLDDLLREIEYSRPFAMLGSKYSGDKWDAFLKELPVSLLDHINGNAIYNVSHPLMDVIIEQLESEAKSPYNSIPFDYRISQIWVEGSKGVVPQLAPKILRDKILFHNTQRFKTLVDEWIKENPFKESQIIKNQAATNLIPRYLGSESIIHGAKIYHPWRKHSNEKITLVVSEWTHNRSKHLLSHLDETDHPFSEVIIMLPGSLHTKVPQEDVDHHYDKMTVVPTRSQYRMTASDQMDLCEVNVETEWFMMTNSYHQVSKHVDLMYVPFKNIPVIPFTPAIYEFCLKYPYCKEILRSAQYLYPGMNKFFHDFDVLYHTETRNEFCDEWKRNTTKTIDDDYFDDYDDDYFKINYTFFDGPIPPTGTSYMAYIYRKRLHNKLYKVYDRSIYGSRYPFVKVFAREEVLDGMMSKEVITQKVSMGGMENLTVGNTCLAYDTVEECEESSLRCSWRPRFESCRPSF